MTVKLLADFPISGTITIPAGRVVNLFDANTESSLIAGKLAVASTAAVDWTMPSKVPAPSEPTGFPSILQLTALARAIRGPVFESLSGIKPTNTPVFSPERHTDFALVSQVGMDVSYDAAAGERGRGALKIVRTAVNTTSRSATVSFKTAATEFPLRNITVGPAVHVRIKCDDWTQVARLYIGFCKVGDLNSYRYWKIVESNASPFGMTDPAMAVAAWNGKWRTLVLHMDKLSAPVGTPDPWDIDHTTMETGALIITANQQTAGTGYTMAIDRVYTQRWPVGFISVILDGAYKSARDLVLPAFNARGWKCGMSGNRVDGSTISGTTYPTFAELAAAAADGHDVFQHGHNVSGTTPLAFDGTLTEAQTIDVLTRQREALLQSLPAGARGPRWIQWLQNQGKCSAGGDMAGVSKRLGANAGRGNCVDAEFGYDFTNGTKTPIWDNSPYSTSGARIGGWVSPYGRFNRAYTEAWARPGGAAETPTTRDTYAGNALQGGVAYAAACASGFHSYIHNLFPFDGTEPAANNAGTRLWADHLADLDDQVGAGKMVVLAPTQVEMLTYWCQDDVYVRWDGEMANRSDNSIAY